MTRWPALPIQSNFWYHVLGWLLTLVVTTGAFALLVPLPMAMLYSLIQVVVLMVVFYLNTQVLAKQYLETNQWARYLGLLVVVLVGTSALRFLVVQQMNLVPLPPMVSPEGRLVFFPVLTTLATLVVSTAYKLLQYRYEREKQFLATINAQNEARLQWLRAQINPHFLFNVLNNIYALAVAKSDAAPAMILRLSELLRYVIYDSRQQTIALSREVGHIRQFIELFQMRYATPRAITFGVTGNPDGRLIEPMVLIPLVENCLKHCDFDTNEAAFIAISLQIDDQELIFNANNSYNAADGQKDQAGGVGLANIRQRLALTYPGRHRLTTEARADQFIVQLTIPA
jgi:two-component system, LytTR family, sensor kinase